MARRGQRVVPKPFPSPEFLELKVRLVTSIETINHMNQLELIGLTVMLICIERNMSIVIDSEDSSKL